MKKSRRPVMGTAFFAAQRETYFLQSRSSRRLSRTLPFQPSTRGACIRELRMLSSTTSVTARKTVFIAVSCIMVTCVK